MAGIIVSTPPTVELPPGNSSSNPSSLPGVTYQYAVLNVPQTWTAKQTFTLGNISLNASDISSGTLSSERLPVPVFNTIAVAQAAAIVAGISTIQTLGCTTVNDGGGMALEVLPSDPGSGQTFALQGGKYGRSIEKVLRPEQFGMFPNSSGAAVQAALVAMATELQRRGGGRIEFPDNVDYRWIDSNPTMSSTTLAFNLSSLRGIRIDFNGSRLITGANWLSQQAVGRLFQLTDCVDVEIKSPRIEQDFTVAITQNYGLSMFSMVGANKDVRIIAPRQLWGTEMLAVVRGGAYSATNRAEDILVDGGRAQGVAYPLNFRKNGDGVEVNRFRAIGCERCYFPYNVRNHWIEIESSGASSTADDCLIKVYADPADSVEENTTANIELFYAARGAETTAARNSYVDFAIQQSTSSAAAGTLRNISVNLDIGPSAWAPSYGIYTQKLDNTGTAESTVRGHIIDNIKISGKVTGSGASALASTKLIALFDTTNGNFAGETVRDIKFTDFVVDATNTTGAFEITATPILSGLVMNNVQSTTAISFAGTLAPQVLKGDNVKSPGYTSNASFSVHKNAVDQTGVANSTYTPVTWPTELYDVGAYFASDAWTPPPGKVALAAAAFFTGTIAASSQIAIAIYKNGALYRQSLLSTYTNQAGVNIAIEDVANGTDVYSVQVSVRGLTGTATINGNAANTWFMGHMI